MNFSLLPLTIPLTYTPTQTYPPTTRLLHSGLFHAVRDQPQLRSKVRLIKGDLCKDMMQSPTPQLHNFEPGQNCTPKMLCASATATAAATNPHSPSSDGVAEGMNGAHPSSGRDTGDSSSSSDIIGDGHPSPGSAVIGGEGGQQEVGWRASSDLFLQLAFNRPCPPNALLLHYWGDFPCIFC